MNGDILLLALAEGAVDRAAGRPLSACPYIGIPEAREAWELGSRHADALLEVRVAVEAACWLAEREEYAA